MSAAGAVSPVPREARGYQGQRAGLITRSAAAVVDGLVVLLVVVLAGLAVTGVRFVLHPRGFDPGPTALLPSLGILLGAVTVYLAVAWTVVGRTYGCHLMGLRVAGRNGQVPGPLVSVARAVLCVLFPVGLLWCAVGRSRRSVQDLLLGTRVLYDWLPHPDGPSSGVEEARLPRNG
jgi:uncharacterized RDD family membrane protein YckC